MPTWVLLSLLFPVLLGVVNTLDKLIVDRYSPSIYFYAFWIGAYELVLGSLAIAIVSVLQGLDSGAFLGGMLAGGIRSIHLLSLLNALKRGQVARVVPIWYLYPLMVTAMAAGFLDERFSLLAWLGIPLAVTGAVLVSWQGETKGLGFGNPTVYLLALGAALFFAVSLVLIKHFVTEDNLWQFYGASRLGFALGMLSVIILPEVRHGVLGMVRSRGFMGFVSLVEGTVTVANIVNLGAIALGPVSLVAALQPTLIFFYALVLAALSPAIFGGWVTKSTLRPQIAGLTAITAGVVLITYSQT